LEGVVQLPFVGFKNNRLLNAYSLKLQNATFLQAYRINRTLPIRILKGKIIDDKMIKKLFCRHRVQ